MRIRNPAERAAEMHRASFDEEPEALAFAPGRVELLGNHTDYNQGLALSAALPVGVAAAVSATSDGRCCAVSADLSAEANFTLWDDKPLADAPWANFVKGVAVELMTRYGPQAHGFHATIAGNLPRGAGLSSSAAVEMATGLAVCKLYGWPDERSELALAGRRAEENYAGVRCGLLDQVTSLYGKPGSMVLADFRSLLIDHVPVPPSARILVINSGVAHDLGESAYNARRMECETALHVLADALDRPLASLRDVSTVEFERVANRLTPVLARRVQHVLEETERVAMAAERLRAEDLDGFGALMFASHESSRTLFENSCEELDMLVGAARSMAGVYGARLSGGGFGGSVVVLVDAAQAETTRAALEEAYETRFNRAAESMIVAPSAGAGIVS
jgi:galactokinase